MLADFFIRLPGTSILHNTVLSNDHDAVESLYLEHRGWLHRWLRARLGCDDQAADFAQSTFLRVLIKHKQLPRIQEPRAFLTTIANGLIIDYWRRQRLERTYREALQQVPLTSLPSEEQRAEILETLVRIDHLLDRLAPRVREAFLLAQLEGLTYKTIAARLGVSERMVKKYMAQAMLHCLLLSNESGDHD